MSALQAPRNGNKTTTGLTRQGTAAAGWERRTAQLVDRQSRDTDTPLVAKRAMTETFTAAADGANYAYTLDDAGNARIRRCTSDQTELVVPDALDGHPIVAIDHSAFAGLKNTASLTLPDSIREIGWNAFANCPSLRRLKLPDPVTKTDKTWLAGSTQIDELIMPGAVETIDAAFLKACKPLHMTIGRATQTVEAPSLWTGIVQEISIDPENPYLSTDGTCLFTHDGSELLRAIVEREHCEVPSGCRIIGPHAFEGNVRVRTIDLPEGLTEIGEGAFEGSGLTEVRLPGSVTAVGATAFARCTALASMLIENGLREIGPRAFAGCAALGMINAPASVERIGKGALAGSGAQLAVDPLNPHLSVDDFGLLYRRIDDGSWELIDATDDTMASCIVRAGTIAIGENACADHAYLEHIELPDGLAEIRTSAFECCPNLRSIDLPDSVRTIGPRAFFCTPIEFIRIPAACTELGECALAYDPMQSGTGQLAASASNQPFAYVGLRPATDSMTAEASRTLSPPNASDNAVADVQLQIRSRLTATPMGGSKTSGPDRAAMRQAPLSVEVAEGNPQFFTEGGLLCENIGDCVRIVLYTGPDGDIAVPAAATEIAPYAFAGARGIERLTLHDRIATVGAGSMSMAEPPRSVRVELSEPIQGQAYVEVPILDGREGIRTLCNAFSVGNVDASALLAAADRAALSTRNGFEGLRYALSRLADPVLLSDDARTGFERTAGRDPIGACVQIAAHEWTQGLSIAADLGYLSSENIDAVIERAGAKGLVSMTVQLIALKRRCFDAGNDYDL